MSVITAEVLGDRELIVRFGRVGPQVHLAVVKAMHSLVIRLQAYVRGVKLSGDPLNRRKGTLSRSIGEQVEDQGGTILGRVGIFSGPTLVYGRAHEFGFHGTVQVREHLRTSKRGLTFPVRAHAMRMNLRERSFLRSSLHETEEAIRAVLLTAVQEGTRATT